MIKKIIKIALYLSVIVGAITIIIGLLSLELRTIFSGFVVLIVSAFFIERISKEKFGKLGWTLAGIFSFIVVASFTSGIIFSAMLVFMNTTEEPESIQEEVVDRVTEYFTGEGWRDFNSPIGQFEASFPKYPTHEIENYSMTIEGVTVDARSDTWGAETTDGSYYMIGVGTYEYSIKPDFSDPEVIDGFLEGSINGALESDPGNKLLSSNYTTFRGYKAIDYHIENSQYETKVEMKGKIFLVGENLYQILLAYELQNYNESDYNHFVESFQLTK